MSDNRTTDEFEGLAGVPIKAPSEARVPAPEVAVGLWKERTYKPRVALKPSEIRSALKAAVESPIFGHDVDSARSRLMAAFVPLFRQAIEQCGGAEVDVYLEALLAQQKVFWPLLPLLNALQRHGRLMGEMPTSEALKNAAKETAEALSAFLEDERPCSFRVLEKKLEGRVGIEFIIHLLIDTPPGLREKINSIDKGIESLRLQLQKMPGIRPDGMFVNFSRLKTEKMLLESALNGH